MTHGLTRGSCAVLYTAGADRVLQSCDLAGKSAWKQNGAHERVCMLPAGKVEARRGVLVELTRV